MLFHHLLLMPHLAQCVESSKCPPFSVNQWLLCERSCEIKDGSQEMAAIMLMSFGKEMGANVNHHLKCITSFCYCKPQRLAYAQLWGLLAGSGTFFTGLFFTTGVKIFVYIYFIVFFVACI